MPRRSELVVSRSGTIPASMWEQFCVAVVGAGFSRPGCIQLDVRCDAVEPAHSDARGNTAVSDLAAAAYAVPGRITNCSSSKGSQGSVITVD